ncbi:hypothetical protein MPSEU_000308800 [Mayamaea pseudoterrestris]|nr:hypothetical protein MPSEU_000308800 [Mayamaea pseudoterrestris]
MSRVSNDDHSRAAFRRHLQSSADTSNSGGSGVLFLQSLVFFGIMIAIFIVVWLVTKVLCRLLMHFSPPATNARRNLYHHDDPRATLRWSEQERRILQHMGVQLTDMHEPRPSLLVRMNGTNHMNLAQSEASRRDFLEHVLITYPYDEATAIVSGDTTDGVATSADGATSPAPPPTISQDAESSSCCPICLDDFSAGAQVSKSFNRQCHHIFHHACILNWLLQDETCPCCRQSFLECLNDKHVANEAGAGGTAAGGGASEEHERQDDAVERTAEVAATSHGERRMAQHQTQRIIPYGNGEEHDDAVERTAEAAAMSRGERRLAQYRLARTQRTAIPHDEENDAYLVDGAIARGSGG